jgi:hypothetical protein
LPQIRIQIPKICVRVVSVPVKRLATRFQHVAGEVARGVPEIMELVPEHALGTWRGGNDVQLERDVTCLFPEGGFSGAGRRLDLHADHALDGAHPFAGGLGDADADGEVAGPRPQ